MNTPVTSPWTFTDTNVTATVTPRFYRAFIPLNYHPLTSTPTNVTPGSWGEVPVGGRSYASP
jgi:hypothetical protein